MAQVLDTAVSMKEILARPLRKVPTLRGRMVCTLFYEASTRTRTSFETAAKVLSADVTSVSTQASSVIKGESFKDTLQTLAATGVDCFVIRHHMAGAPHYAAQIVKGPVINGGDGMHEHPTQGLLDLFTIRERLGDLQGRKIAIIGDILHSRVARSNTWGFTQMGAQVALCGPRTMMPPNVEELGVRDLVSVTSDLCDAIEGADVVYVLRIQLERQKAALFPSVREYAHLFGLNSEKLKCARPDALVMHPGPMNRGIEISAELADSERAVILDQVQNGVAVRMAILYLLLGGHDG
jgi:aspartate carbamoyltransferase catalytic subunit